MYLVHSQALYPLSYGQHVCHIPAEATNASRRRPESNRQGLSLDRLPTGSRRGAPTEGWSGSPSISLLSFSSPTRTRTRNTLLEARDDFLFTIEPQRKARDLNPHDPRESHGLANRPGKPYPATFRLIEWSQRESNPDCQSAELVSSRWTMAPSVDRRGVEPRLPGCKSGVFPLDEQPIHFYTPSSDPPVESNLQSSDEGEGRTPTRPTLRVGARGTTF